MKCFISLLGYCLLCFPSLLFAGDEEITAGKCITCHKEMTPGLYKQWLNSSHAAHNITCYDCHNAKKNEPDAFIHEGAYISTLVTPKDCGECHPGEMKEVDASYHATAGLILESNDAYLGHVAGGLPAVIAGCESCHGANVRIDPKSPNKLAIESWPNSGIGRINPDGSKGSCSACHTRHSFSKAQARQPETCGKCHLGPDHPQKEIFEESKHGIAYYTNIEAMNLNAGRWVVGQDYFEAPTCATCHMSATMNPEWVAYQASPHARVKCVECHVGEGMGALIDAKINGAWQIISLTFSLYENPIPTPVQNLRPARETCEKCHWPDEFLGNHLKIITHYGFDEASTPKYTTLNLKIGSGQEGLASGIHWHIAAKNQVHYLHSDEKRYKIKWVEVRQAEGGFKRYNNRRMHHQESGDEFSIRVLDCIDCHNRATHIYENPEYAIDYRIDRGILKRNIPFIKREGLAAITKNYPDKARGRKMIRIRLENFYRDNYPQFSGSNSARIDSVIEVLQEIYHRNIHPGMEIEWGSYPNHIGHRSSPGCFRCHNPDMVDEAGNSISNDCTLCHSILAFDSDEPFKHLLPLNEKESEYPMRKYLKEEFTKNY
ncbi:MAG: hypothetical protein HQ591_09990 [candidate division Zixibacteria bacterium]|nr:hypothetical protein [Candidatus Tariuqbacter arcticus]